MIEVKTQIPEEYDLNIVPLSTSKISFSEFYNKSVLDWCLNHCELANISGHCPNEKNNFNKEGKHQIKQFKDAYLVFIKVPSKELTWEGHKQGHSQKSQLILYNLLNELKTKLKEDGHFEFLLLAAGPCKKVFCKDVPCQLLEKGCCSQESKALPAMEAFGINVFETAENANETIHWIQKDTSPNSIPYGSRVGLICFK
ncbi:hypothetical protein HN592_02060 [Candidatus Woesearchaeota archaeon]|jgi:predicted metal-binding protein|nr:hypothetical protein [Candidatus Woesearchaeota archaeon]MBT4367997.1 hypothetical protein [Candidatus Woesearchaeota archaeon]MBT4712485.1 hypothetical protein [Candidatus Woesearchaeota archaeon]MBT6639398.1 hypothetical protein [Candidatus Woesearchaeota archaeon]MBT7133570.1 hypothetical protein [Candidatus Woesearchaeota archaeon]